MQSEYHKFAVEETCASGLSARFLVSPWGSFDGKAKLGIWLNYPTMNSKHLYYGSQVADPTNQCTRMLDKKGLYRSQKEVNAWELWHRRESTAGRKNNKRPWDGYATDIERDIHLEFALRCMILSAAKVNILFGAWVRRAFLKRFARQVHTFFVEDVTVHIVQGQDETVTTIAVECPHPESLFWARSEPHGALMDSAVGLAAGLSKLTTALNSQYFSWLGSQLATEQTTQKPRWVIPTHGTDRLVRLKTLLKWENDNATVIPYDEIPQQIREDFALRTGIPNTQESFCSLDLGNQTLIAAIHCILADSLTRQSWKCQEPGCDKIYMSAQSLRQHQEHHHSTAEPRTWPCDEPGCDRVYTAASSLQRHQIRGEHSTRKPSELPTWQCDEPGCDNFYLSLNNLHKHRRNKHPKGNLEPPPKPSTWK